MGKSRVPRDKMTVAELVKKRTVGTVMTFRGFTRSTTCRSPGTSSLSNSSRLPLSSGPSQEIPVRFHSGRTRRETRPALNRIAERLQHDGDRRRRALRGQRGRSGVGKDHVNLEAGQFGTERLKTIIVSIGIPALDDEGFSFNDRNRLASPLRWTWLHELEKRVDLVSACPCNNRIALYTPMTRITAEVLSTTLVC